MNKEIISKHFWKETRSGLFGIFPDVEVIRSDLAIKHYDLVERHAAGLIIRYENLEKIFKLLENEVKESILESFIKEYPKFIAEMSCLKSSSITEVKESKANEETEHCENNFEQWELLSQN